MNGSVINRDDFHSYVWIAVFGFVFIIIAGYFTAKNKRSIAGFLFMVGMGLMYFVQDGLLPFKHSQINSLTQPVVLFAPFLVSLSFWASSISVWKLIYKNDKSRGLKM